MSIETDPWPVQKQIHEDHSQKLKAVGKRVRLMSGLVFQPFHAITSVAPLK